MNVSDAWKKAHPGATIGILEMANVANPKRNPELEKKKGELEEQLRRRFSEFDRAGLRALPILGAYYRYYRRFRKTYHVQHQLESVVFKGKTIPTVAALVEAMFMAELKSQLLTAGHDFSVLDLPVTVRVADGGERYTRIDGREQQLKSGDMMIADTRGIISSVLYGPDRRTCIGPDTRHVLFTVYAPPGIDPGTVRDHLEDMVANVRLFSPDATIGMLDVLGTA